MDYTLDEQQEAVRDLAASVLADRERFAPGVSPEDWPDRRLWADLAQAGLLGIAVPEEHGGSGAGWVEQCLVLEQVARAAGRVSLLETAVLGALVVSTFGDREQVDRLVRPFCEGALTVTSGLGMTPDGSVSLIARSDAGTWVLDGTVKHVPHADEASRVLVEAVDGAGRRGYFLVDPSAVSVLTRPHSSVDRRPRSHLSLTASRVPATDVIAAPGDARADDVGSWVRLHGSVALCITQAACCEAALQMTAEHVRTREQFGRPVGTFQAVAHRVADAYMDTLAMRLTAWRAAWFVGEGEPADEAVAIATWWAADAATRVTESAMHLHGGLSVDLDYPLHLYHLAARQAELSLGGPARRLADLGDLLAVAS